jgi:aspartate 1-decarboxylase
MGHSLRNVFFPDLEKDEKMVVASFCKMSAENALKVKPKVILSFYIIINRVDNSRVTTPTTKIYPC